MKKTLIGITLLIVAIFCYLFWYYTSSGDDEIHLLSKNFNGIVYIYFDSQNGSDERYEGKKRVYEVPSNGILKTKFKTNNGWHSPAQFYYLDSNKRIPINNKTSKVKIYGQQIIGIGNDISGKTTKYLISYIVSSKEKVDSLYGVREKKALPDLP